MVSTRRQLPSSTVVAAAAPDAPLEEQAVVYADAQEQLQRAFLAMLLEFPKHFPDPLTMPEELLFLRLHTPRFGTRTRIDTCLPLLGRSFYAFLRCTGGDRIVRHYKQLYDAISDMLRISGSAAAHDACRDRCLTTEVYEAHAGLQLLISKRREWAGRSTAVSCCRCRRAASRPMPAGVQPPQLQRARARRRL